MSSSDSDSTVEAPAPKSSKANSLKSDKKVNSENDLKKKKGILASSDEESASSSDEDVSNQNRKPQEKFKINKDYAKSFDEKKRKAELRRLKDMNLEDESDSSSGEEEDDGKLLTTWKDVEIMKTLQMIKSKDPRIYDSNYQLYEDEEEDASSDDEAKAKKPKNKKVTAKDLIREEILKNADADEVVKGEESSGDEGENESGDKRGKSYHEEQTSIKREFKKKLLDAVDDDDDDAFFEVKKKTNEQRAAEELEYGAWIAEDTKVLKKLSDEDKELLKGFAKEEAKDEGAKFLQDFFLNKRWVDEDDDDDDDDDDDVASDDDVKTSTIDTKQSTKKQPNKQRSKPGPEEEDEGDEEVADVKIDDDVDEKELERQDRFEAKYNFRFEEADGGEIKTFARSIEGTVRRKDDKRKKQRDEMKARKEIEKARKVEELKRLKNLKKQEIMKKLQEISSVAGGGLAGGFLDADLDGDFDPDAHDKRMQDVFNDDYYQVEGDDDDGENVKPVWNDEDDIEVGGTSTIGKLKDVNPEFAVSHGDYANDEDEAFAPMIEGEEEGGATYYEDEEYPEDMEEESLEKLAKSTPGASKLLDDLYKLDYEDMIGDLPTRFKYRPVKPSSFGLTSDEIMAATDSELNMYVGLKRIAPFRETEWKASKSRKSRFQQIVDKRVKQHQEKLAAASSGVANGDSKVKGEKKKKKDKKPSKGEGEVDVADDAGLTSMNSNNADDDVEEESDKKKKKSKKRARVEEDESATAPVVSSSVAVEESSEKKSRKRRRKQGGGSTNSQSNPEILNATSSSTPALAPASLMNSEKVTPSFKAAAVSQPGTVTSQSAKEAGDGNEVVVMGDKARKKKEKKQRQKEARRIEAEKRLNAGLDAARLSAYGI